MGRFVVRRLLTVVVIVPVITLLVFLMRVLVPGDPVEIMFMGQSADEICAERDLTLADVHAALAYYFDHREEIDGAIKADEDFVAELRLRKPSLLQRKLNK